MEIEGAGGDAEYKKLEAVVNMFAGYNDNLAKEGELKDAIRKVTKEIDGKCREMKTILGQIHSGRTDVAAVCARARAFVPGLKANFAELKEVAQKNKHYYQYREFWKNAQSTIVFLVGLVQFLEDGRLISLREVEEMLDLPGEVEAEGAQSSFAIDIPDFLYGLAMIPNELSRLCVNRATAGDYEMVSRIGNFVNELYAGFQLLNLKNDFLRKKYDSIKYDLKKIEEVTYDLSIRGLIKSPGAVSAPASSMAE
ncbi:translin [Acanthamoeba castellanii str. Neff]|uniref:Translin n=1 Tax=Acanthamoeba castellanii (strain ATCC 30010 / Neff) TaxID=1257118 RepID=L8GNL1_ACACF|nr:translin [Acanthamoeba castellanii str. Neff]ELR14338.1 translin [Acanthamoeba castellanii str. Neff]